MITSHIKGFRNSRYWSRFFSNLKSSLLKLKDAKNNEELDNLAWKFNMMEEITKILKTKLKLKDPVKSEELSLNIWLLKVFNQFHMKTSQIKKNWNLPICLFSSLDSRVPMFFFFISYVKCVRYLRKFFCWKIG